MGVTLGLGHGTLVHHTLLERHLSLCFCQVQTRVSATSVHGVRQISSPANGTLGCNQRCPMLSFHDETLDRNVVIHVEWLSPFGNHKIVGFETVVFEFPSQLAQRFWPCAARTHPQ